MIHDHDIRPTVAVDLDGVLAQYTGWQGLEHIGEPIEGAREFLTELRRNWRVLIHTTRTSEAVNQGAEAPELVRRVRHWLEAHALPYDDIWRGDGKPLAYAYVDARAIACRPQCRSDPRAEFGRVLMTLEDREVRL